MLYSAGALALASTGYGALRSTTLFGLDEKLHHPVVTTLALAGGVAAAYAILAQRDTSPPDGTLAQPTIPGKREHNGAAAGATPSPAGSRTPIREGSAAGAAASPTRRRRSRRAVLPARCTIAASLMK